MKRPTNHFKSFNVVNTFQKSTDPVKAYGIYNTEITESSNMTKKTMTNKNKKFSSHKNIGYIMTDNFSSNGTSTNTSNNSFSHSLSKKHSNSRITIDLNDSVTSKNSSNVLTTVQNDPEDFEDMLGSNYKLVHFELSQAGKDEQGKTKTNQDNYVMLDSMFNNPKISIFGVLDGHGTNGHLVSDYV